MNMMLFFLELFAIVSRVAAQQQCPEQLQGKCQQSATLLKALPGNGSDACCSACMAEKHCAGWTLNSKSGKCFLHTDWVSPTAAAHCTSGRMHSPPAPPPSSTLNVLLIIVDDLRPDIAAPGYDQSFMITPNINRLAAKGTVFSRAYCQQAICGPTRNSFLSGRRPQRTQAWNFIDHFREVGPDWVSFPGYFKNAGYSTYGTGKTYHPNLPPNNDGNLSWSSDREYVSKGDGKVQRPPYVPIKGKSVVQIDTTPASQHSHYSDGANLDAILDDMQYAQSKGGPFFLAYGIHKPHLPFHFPEEMWNMYPALENIGLPKHQEAPDKMPPIAFTYEMDGKTEISVCVSEDNCADHPIPYPHNHSLPDKATRAMRKGYYAAVTWTDSLIGKALDRLEALGYANDTVVALIGDHGWQLGEHNIWGKHTNFELGARVPIIIAAPHRQGGIVSSTLVESVDLYPTLAALAGLPPPPDVDGTDLSPLVGKVGTVNKTAAYSEYPRCPRNVSQPWTDTTSCVHTPRENFTVMGYSVRTEDWRYTIWLHWDGKHLVGDFSQPPVAVELYSHAGDKENDFDAFENANLADDPKYAHVLAEHRSLAVAHWRKHIDVSSGEGLLWI